MNQIDNVECFKNCTQLCKPHESNKAVWDIYQAYDKEQDKKVFKDNLLELQKEVKENIIHSEFI